MVKSVVEDHEYDVSFWNVSCKDGFENLRMLTYRNVSIAFLFKF